MTMLHRSYMPLSRTDIYFYDLSGVRENEIEVLTPKNATSVAHPAPRLIRDHFHIFQNAPSTVFVNYRQDRKMAPKRT